MLPVILGDLGVKTLFIEPGSPWENGYNESFNGTLRNELLKREIFFAIPSYGLSGLIAFGTIVSPQSSESARCETCHFRVGDAKSAVPGPTFRSSPKTLDGNLWRALRRVCLPCHWRRCPTARVPY